ncbi:MAG: methyltransferase domain-containing protein [Anaerolineales bacterium]
MREKQERIASHQDIWSIWLLHRRDADDPQAQELTSQYLRPIRDRVLDNAAVGQGEVLLDVGCGEGLIGFGALERTRVGTVIFSDISQYILTRCKELAEELGLIDRCDFVRAPAEDLFPLPDASVSIVTTRSVLIYVQDKARAFQEFHRVLAPGGRFSLFEPINSFAYPGPDHMFAGFDVTEVEPLARKVKAIYRAAYAAEDDPMIHFNERDLFRYAEEVGFGELHLHFEATLEPRGEDARWDVFLRRAPNPLAPTLEEAVSEALLPSEGEEFLAHLRPLVEARKGSRKMAVAYFWGKKDGDG